MKNTTSKSIPETLPGLALFLEECRKETNRIGQLERLAQERYKNFTNGKNYEYKTRSFDGRK